MIYCGRTGFGQILRSFSVNSVQTLTVLVSVGTKFPVFLQRYFWRRSKSLVCQEDKSHSGQIQLFGNGQSSVPSSGSFLIASRLTSVPPCLVPAMPG